MLLMSKMIIENLSNLGITRQSMIQNGFSSQKYDDIQRGKSSYRLQDIIEISEKFQLSLDCLVYGKEAPQIKNLSADQQELLDKYKSLSEREQGRVLQFMANMIEAKTSTGNVEATPTTDTAKPTATLEQKKHFA